MDLAQIRKDLASVAGAAGFNAWNIGPDDPQDLPAAVVAGVHSIRRLTIGGVCEVGIDVELYASKTDQDDASAVLDLALSLGMADSLLSRLEDVALIGGNAPSWRSIRFVAAGPYRDVAMPGGGTALAVTVAFELTA